MLRTVSAVPMNASSPSKLELTKQTESQNEKTLLFNLNKVGLNKNKRKKVEVVSSDDESYDEKLYETNEQDEEEEKQLENLVFGSDKIILDNIDHIQKKPTSNATTKIELAEHFIERKPVWQDDNEEQVDKQEQVSNKFTKYFGTPLWADLESAKKKKKTKKRNNLFKINKTGTDQTESEEEEEDETDDESMFHQTGNYLADTNRINSTASALPKTNLDIKVCTDANKEEPHNVTLNLL